MEITIHKLITEYESKVVLCDYMLTNIKGLLIAARNVNDTETKSDLKADRKEWAARRQAYVQAISDFKSILGEI